VDNEYRAWKENPNQDNLNALIGASQANIKKALQMYVGYDEPAIRAHAKILAVKAFKSFDPKKGARLRTHFLNQLQPLRRFSAKRRFVFNVPEKAQIELAGISTAKKELHDRLNREPTDLELADHMGLSMRRIQKLRQLKMPMSEGGRVDEDGEVFQDISKTTSKLDTWADFVYHDLNPTDRKIFEWRTGFNGRKQLKNGDIAKKLKMTPGAITQRVNKIYDTIAEGVPNGW